MKITKEQLRKIIKEEIVRMKHPLTEDTFGMRKKDYDALIAASKRKRYNPSKEKVAALKTKYPKVKEEDLITALLLTNSPARSTFTTFDVVSHLKKLNK